MSDSSQGTDKQSKIYDTAEELIADLHKEREAYLQTLRCGFATDNCDGFECTSHCCVLRCTLHPELRVCPDIYTLRRCPKNFKGRRLG